MTSPTARGVATVQPHTHFATAGVDRVLSADADDGNGPDGYPRLPARAPELRPSVPLVLRGTDLPAFVGPRRGELRVRQPQRDAAPGLRVGAPRAPRSAEPGVVRVQAVRAKVAAGRRTDADEADRPRLGSGRRRDDERRLRGDRRRAP